MTTIRLKRLSDKEAARLARQVGDLRVFTRRDANGVAIIEVPSIGDIRVHGRHPSNWRKAFAAAGLHLLQRPEPDSP
jgi:protein involved in polysaccharide export with SLBB domain